MAEKGIVYRLGWVLYWAACIFAGMVALIFISVASVGEASTDWESLLLVLGVVVGTWLIGRAIRYVLAGD